MSEYKITLSNGMVVEAPSKDDAIEIVKELQDDDTGSGYIPPERRIGHTYYVPNSDTDTWDVEPLDEVNPWMGVLEPHTGEPIDRVRLNGIK